MFELFHRYSQNFFINWLRFERATIALEDTFQVCHHEIESGSEFYFDPTSRLVLRRAGNEDYPIEEASLESDTVVVVKDDQSRVLMASNNMNYVTGRPSSMDRGKTPLQIYGAQAGGLIRRNDLSALKNGPDLFPEHMFIDERAFDRISYRFPLTGHLRKFGRIGVICFNRATALKCPQSNWVNRKQTILQEKLEVAIRDTAPPDTTTLKRHIR